MDYVRLHCALFSKPAAYVRLELSFSWSEWVTNCAKTLPRSLPRREFLVAAENLLCLTL